MTPEGHPAARAAVHYHRLGYNPLPSRSDVKGPACQDYARYRDGERIPDQWLERWWGENLQLCLGVPWRLLVVDLDGVEAQFRWHQWTKRWGCPRTWTVRTGGGGIHVYFATRPEVRSVKSRKVWGVWDGAAKAWVKHTFIEVLGDKSLAIAPPSRHVDTGQWYAFLPGRDPDALPRPALAPAWILALPALRTPQPVRVIRPRPPAWTTASNRRVDRAAIIDGLSDDHKLDVAVGAGLVLAGKVNSAGWVSCRSIFREDRHPSASFCPRTGVYWEFGMKSLSFFDLLVELGAYGSWRDACESLEALT